MYCSLDLKLHLLMLRSHDIKLWGCAKPSHTQIIQQLQSKFLRSITNAPRYVSNLKLHTGPTHSICGYGDWQVIPPLPPTAGRPSQRPHHRDDHSTQHRKKDWRYSDRLIYITFQRKTNLASVSPISGSRRSVINGWLLPSCYLLLAYLIIAPYKE